MNKIVTITICIIIVSVFIIDSYVCAQMEESLEEKVNEKHSIIEKGTSTPVNLEELEAKRLEEINTKQKIHEEKIGRGINQYFPPELIKEKPEETECYFIEVDLNREGEIGTSTDTTRILEEDKEVVALYSNWDQKAKVVVLREVDKNYIEQWQSPLIDGYHGTIEVRDINNDKQKEIIARGYVGAHASESVWIYTWDGIEGRLISPVDEQSFQYSGEFFSLFGGD